MKHTSEQFGRERNTHPRPKGLELAPQRATFTESSPNASGERASNGRIKAGADRHWEPQPNYDAPVPPTPVSATPDTPRVHKGSGSDAYIGEGVYFDEPHGRVPDAGKDWAAGPRPGEPVEPIKVETTPASKRPIVVGWKNKGYDTDESTFFDRGPKSADKVGQTPQRAKFRKMESK